MNGYWLIQVQWPSFASTLKSSFGTRERRVSVSAGGHSASVQTRRVPGYRNVLTVSPDKHLSIAILTPSAKGVLPYVRVHRECGITPRVTAIQPATLNGAGIAKNPLAQHVRIHLEPSETTTTRLGLAPLVMVSWPGATST